MAMNRPNIDAAFDFIVVVCGKLLVGKGVIKN